MTKKQVLDTVNKYYAYHRSSIRHNGKFKLINKVATLSGHAATAYGAYFNYDKKLYAHRGRYLYTCAITIKNPYITTDQIYSALITRQKKSELYKKGYDSVVLVMFGEIIEVVCFTNKQIELHDRHDDSQGINH